MSWCQRQPLLDPPDLCFGKLQIDGDVTSVGGSGGADSECGARVDLGDDRNQRSDTPCIAGDLVAGDEAVGCGFPKRGGSQIGDCNE